MCNRKCYSWTRLAVGRKKSNIGESGGPGQWRDIPPPSFGFSQAGNRVAESELVSLGVALAASAQPSDAWLWYF